MILLFSANALFAADARAATNLWSESVGESWFWETRDWPAQVLAGTWWTDELEPGKRYQVTFRVDDLRGKMAVLLADEAAISIDRTGSYTYDFTVAEDGKRRMIFQTSSTDVMASVTSIVVNEQSSPPTQNDDIQPEAGSPDPTGNIWKNTFGQEWFYETSSASGQLLAGTRWESSLIPGNTYKIAFKVKSVRGKVGLLVGDNPVVEITEPGTYHYEFHISEGGQRRMLFQSLSNNVAVSVSGISVAKGWTAPTDGSVGANGNSRGHYLSFARARNLKAEMLDLVQHPHTARSNYHLRIAQELDAALRTSGVTGVWMAFRWRDLEVADGQYNWSVLDQNIEVARQYGLKFIVAVHDRSFDGSTDVLPAYFPSEYVLWSSGGGKSGVVAKRWDPYVYTRQIRLYKAIANRYADNAAFAGVASSETANGHSGSDYTPAKYRQALTQIATQTQVGMKNGKFFFYLNFLSGGQSPDMNKDQRVAIVKDVPHANLVIGAPDVTPDVQGMPGSATAYRIHVRKTMPDVEQFCHMQHVDHGEGGINVKSNTVRQQYFNQIARIRDRESDRWFKGTPAAFQVDDLRDPNGNKVDLHPDWVLGDLWKLDELFHFGQRNFGCDYTFWHYREHARVGEFGWRDTRPVILNNQFFYQ